MLVKFGMDTEQIVANSTNIFWMHSFISGHKKVEYTVKCRYNAVSGVQEIDRVIAVTAL